MASDDCVRMAINHSIVHFASDFIFAGGRSYHVPAQAGGQVNDFLWHVSFWLETQV